MSAVTVPTAGALFLVLDLETSGLDPSTCELLEIGARLFDPSLQEINTCWIGHFTNDNPGYFVNTRLQPTNPLVVGHNAEQGALDLHAKTGLFNDWHLARPIAEVEAQIIKGLDDAEIVGEGRNSRINLVGRNPSFDMGFLKRHMPRLAARLHYRMIDVDSFELVAALTLGTAPSRIRQAFIGNHRALDDVDSTVREFRMFAEAAYASRSIVAAACGIAT